MDYKREYNRWLEFIKEEKEIISELKDMDELSVEDAFYQDLSFGTGGLRGVIGAGTNRMNVFTVRKASQGLANYILKRYTKGPSIAVSYDSRIKSDIFARAACSVFAENGIKAWLYPQLMPTPCLSYAVRVLGCSAGIMITASHNPARYNGYKVYGDDGCQITTDTAREILNEIERLDIFGDVRTISFDEAISSGLVEYIPTSIYDSFIDEVKKQSVLFGDEINRDVAIVYSPFNGTGLGPVTRIMSEGGFNNVTIVSEQEQPNGYFPTCPYPNPEIKEAMRLGVEYCKHVNADIFLATDPDCDRCGVAVKGKKGYQLLTGNEIGLLLLDFICNQRVCHSRMPERPVFVKTIVTTELAEKIASHYGVQTINVLTGFKYIGEVIGKLEKQGRIHDYICGFEESCGYLTGFYVRDKDAVNAVFMICEMFAYYKTRGISLIEKLDELYENYGYYFSTLHFYEFNGNIGMQKMNDIMSSFRSGMDEIGGQTVEKFVDYSIGLGSLPKSNVLKYCIKSGFVVVRPSGTEPKLKVYISVAASNKEEAKAMELSIKQSLERYIN